MNLYLFCQLPIMTIFYMGTERNVEYMKADETTAIWLSPSDSGSIQIHPHVLVIKKDYSHAK